MYQPAAGNRTAGFVLAGGESRRMGRDKALLPAGGATLVEHVAAQVRAAAGSVMLIGAPHRYYDLGLPAIADTLPACGPLGGILTALRVTDADWNLVVACDMPAVTAVFLRSLLDAACGSDADCLAPVSPGGRLEPLCAAYHRRSAGEIESALRAGVRKTGDGLAGLNLLRWPVAEAAWFENVNTPEDWSVRHNTR